MDDEDWDRRYAERELVWSAGPTQVVAEFARDLPPGRALDLAAGEGRNALWLGERGWRVTAVDFSRVALDRAAGLARDRLSDPDAVQLVRADLAAYRPPSEAFDLVLVVYLQVPAELRRTVLGAAASALAPGGRLLVLAHDSENLARGHGGPSNPAVLYTAADVVRDIDGRGLTVLRAERIRRAVPTDDGERTALDCLVVAGRPALHAGRPVGDVT